jgi:hypothetical protein
MDKFVSFANNTEKINDLVKKTGRSKTEIQDSLLNVFGELGAENNWTTSKGKGLGSRLENIAESVITELGSGKNLSVGPGQIKYNSIPKDLKKAYNINSPNDLYDVDKVLPLMAAMDLKDKQVLEEWGKQNKLSQNLFGFTNPVETQWVEGKGNVPVGDGFTIKDLPAFNNDDSQINNTVGRYSPYLRNQYSSIANNTFTTGKNDWKPFNEKTSPNNTSLKTDEETNIKYTKDPRSYPDKVEQNWRNNLNRFIVKNEEGAIDLPEAVVQKQLGGENMFNVSGNPMIVPSQGSYPLSYRDRGDRDVDGALFSASKKVSRVDEFGKPLTRNQIAYNQDIWNDQKQAYSPEQQAFNIWKNNPENTQQGFYDTREYDKIVKELASRPNVEQEGLEGIGKKSKSSAVSGSGILGKLNPFGPGCIYTDEDKSGQRKRAGGLVSYQTAGTVKYGTPEYAEAYNKGEVVTDEGVRSPIALDEVVVQNNYKRPRGFWEQYRDKIVEENKDTGPLGAAVGVPISAVFSLPQLAMMKAFTGEMQRPSEAMDIENPWGAMTVDAIADPANLVGAGLLTKEKALAKLAASKESGLLSNAYKYNPLAFKPNPESAYRMIGGKEGYLDAINSGEIRAVENGVYGDAHFNMGLPLNPNRLSSEELIKAGSPGGYKGPYMVERRWADNAWNKHAMTDAFKNSPEIQEELIKLGKDKDVWGKYGNLETNDNAVRLYKEHWLKGYKEIPKQNEGGLIKYQKAGTVKKWLGNTLTPEGYVTSTTKGGNRISFTGDQRSDEWINKQIDSGKFGFDPTTGGTFPLKKPVKGLSKEDQFIGSKEYYDLQAPYGFNTESQLAQIKKLPEWQQDIVYAASTKRRKSFVSDQWDEVYKSPLWYAPGIIATGGLGLLGLEAVGAAAAPYITSALASQLPGLAAVPGATVGNVITAGFAGHGLANVAPDAAAMYKNPTWSNAGSLAMDALEIAPIVGPAGKMMGEGISATRRALTTEESALAKLQNIRNIAPKLESEIAALKQQETLAEESRKALYANYKNGNITAEEYTSGAKQLNPNKLLESRNALEKQLRDNNIKQEIVNTPQQNILKSENQLGKNISDGGTNNKGVFELGDNYVARLSAHGYDDSSRLVNYADKIKSPRTGKTLQVKEIDGKVYQVQNKATGTPITKLSETDFQNMPKEHIDNFWKDKAELDNLGLSIDISGGKSNVFYDPKKGFQIIDLGIGKSPTNQVISDTYKGLPLSTSVVENTGNVTKNLGDLNYAKNWAKQYGYKLPENFERIAQSTELTNKTMRGLANRHNTFVRGVSTNWEVIAQKNPEIITHLESKGFNLGTEKGSKAAAEYMGSHEPINTGYGRFGLKEGENALYLSNSVPTAEGYTYGNGYIVKVKRPTDFSSPNRQDWLTTNDFDVHLGFKGSPFGEGIVKNDYIKRFPTNFRETLAITGDPNKMVELQAAVKEKEALYNELAHASWKKHHNLIDDLKYKTDAKFREHTISDDPFVRDVPNFFDKMQLKYLQNKKDLTQNYYNVLPLKDVVKGVYGDADVWKSFGKNLFGKLDPFSHYAIKGQEGEKVLEALRSTKINPETWSNTSRAHINKYTDKLSRKKQGGTTVTKQKKALGWINS